MTHQNNKHKIVIIGGGEIFIQNRPQGQIQFGPENPGAISLECTGPAWHMALELIADGCGVEFISVAGDDFAGHAMKARLSKAGVGVDHFHLVPGKDTAAKHEILNLLDQPEMEFQNDEVFSCMTTDMIDRAAPDVQIGDSIVLETRFPEAVINHIVNTFPDNPILLRPVAERNAERAKGVLHKVEGLLAGRRHAEVLSDLPILSEEELQAAAAWFTDLGIQQVFIDLGFGGVYFKDNVGEGAKRPGPARPAAIAKGFAGGKTAEQTAGESIEQQGGE